MRDLIDRQAAQNYKNICVDILYNTLYNENQEINIFAVPSARRGRKVIRND